VVVGLRDLDLRVLLISTSSGSTGGGEYYLASLAIGLQRLGMKVTLIINTHEDMDYFYSRFGTQIHIKRLKYTNTYKRKFRVYGASLDRRSIKNWVGIIKSESPDIIHLNQQTLEDGIDIYLAAKDLPIPLVCTTHVPHSASFLGARFGWIRDILTEKLFNAGPQNHICVSQKSAETLMARIPAVSGRNGVHTVFNGVDIPMRETDVATLQSELKISNESRVIGMVGRIESQKNPLFSIEMLSALKDPDLVLLWIGDGSLREEFLLKAQRLGVADQVRVSGWIHQPSDYFCLFDVFCMPSQYEGLPLALLEAMRAGLPVMVNDIDGFRDVIELEKGGYLLPKGDLQRWVSAVKQLMQDDTLRLNMGKYNKQLAEQRYSIDAMSQETASVYDSLITQ